MFSVLNMFFQMTKQFAVNKNLLPPKKLLGNRSESFIIQRQRALEIYLQTLVQMFSLLPEPLALFLDLQKYVSFNLSFFNTLKLHRL